MKSIKELDMDCRIKNWSIIVHNGELKGYRTGDYPVGQ